MNGSAIMFKSSYSFMYKELFSPYIGTGIAFILYEVNNGDSIRSYNSGNGFVGIPFGIGLDILRNTSYRIMIEANAIFAVSETNITYNDNSTTTVNKSYLFSFSFKIGFSLFSGKESCCLF